MKRNVGVYLTVGLLLIVMLLIVTPGAPPSGSSFDSKPPGTLAFYETLKRSGVNLQRFFKTYDKLPRNLDNVLFIVAPHKNIEPTPLIDWISRGNTAVVFDADNTSSELFRKRVGIKYHLVAIDELDRFIQSRESYPIWCAQEDVRLPECADTYLSSSLTTFGFTPPADAVVVIGNEDEAFATYKQIGQGGLWFFTSHSLVSNEHIDKLDNFRLLYQIATKHSTTLVDEYTHGYPPPPEDLENEYSGHFALANILVVVTIILSVLARLMWKSSQWQMYTGRVNTEGNIFYDILQLYERIPRNILHKRSITSKGK